MKIIFFRFSRWNCTMNVRSCSILSFNVLIKCAVSISSYMPYLPCLDLGNGCGKSYTTTIGITHSFGTDEISRAFVRRHFPLLPFTHFELYSWRTWCNEGWRRNEEIKNKILQHRLRVRSMFNCNVLQYLSALTSSLEHLCTINVLHFNFERHIFPWKRILKQSREKCISVSDAIIF